jgi:hypothetical protein
MAGETFSHEIGSEAFLNYRLRSLSRIPHGQAPDGPHSEPDEVRVAGGLESTHQEAEHKTS